MRWCLAGFAILALAACTPDVLVAGSGGAASATSSSSVAVSSTSVASSTSTGSNPDALPPCGGVTDAFSVEDGAWLGGGGYVDGRLVLTIATSSHFATYKTAVPAPHDCSLSVGISLANYVGASTSIALGLTDAADMKWVYSAFDGVDTAQGLSSDGVTTDSPAPSTTTRLGVVFEADSVHFLYGDGAGWHPIGTTNRKDWMDADVRLEIGVAGPAGTSAQFDDFGLLPIALSDL